MKSYLRFLWRNKLYTGIELAGLAVALAFVLFIATFVVNELGYDKPLENTESIYIGASEGYTTMSYTIGDVMCNAFPEIEAKCGFVPTSWLGGVQMEATVGNETFKQNAFVVDRNFFDFFTFSFVEGDRATALREGDAVVVSQSFANRYFPDKSALGQIVTIIIDGKKSVLRVSGVMEDIKRSVFPQTDLFYGMQHIENNYPDLIRNGNGTATTFYRIKDGTDIAGLDKKALEKAKQDDMLYNVGLFKSFNFYPFAQIHYGVSENQQPFVGKINLDFVLLFMGVGILLLVFAILNYISLTVAQVGFRAKEMATRQLLGEQRSEILIRYVKEAFLLTVAAFCMAFVIAEVLRPYFSELLGKEISLFAILDFKGVFVIVVFLFIIALLAGLVPALLVSRYKPISVIKGEFAASSKMTLGKGFMFFQNAVAIVTLCVSFAMFLQFKHLLERDGGYNRDNIITVAKASRAELLYEDEIKTLPCVGSVGHVQFAPVDNGRSNQRWNSNGEQINLTVMCGDSAAFNMLGFRIISVSSADVSNEEYSYWLTESAMKSLGLGYDTTGIALSHFYFPICGVIKDFQTADNSIEECSTWNLVFCNMKYKPEKNFSAMPVMLLKVVGDENDALQQIKKFYEDKGLGNEVVVITHNEIYRGYYSGEENNMELIGIFALLTIMLSSLAMLAMSTYFAKQQAKNYSIKKVFGFERSEIYFSMAGRFLQIVALAAVVAIPLAYYLVGEWLKDYSYRIDNMWWIYLAAVAMIAVVALLVISWQAIKLMNANPVEELKKE